MSNYATSENILQVVQTYQRSGLLRFQNLNANVSIANKKYKEFNLISANLGSTVTMDLPPLAQTSSGLVATFQPAVQRVIQLVVDQSNNSSIEASDQQRIFNLEKGESPYLDEFLKSCVVSLANTVEANIALNWASAVTNNDTSIPQNPLIGTLNTFSGPFRYYGDGNTTLNSYQQLADMIARFKNPGSVQNGIKVILPDLVIPTIVGTGLNQFAPRRNDEIAMSWEIGDFGNPPVSYYQSNQLPIHTAGNVGFLGQNLTVISVNDPTGKNVTQITLSGATPGDQNAVYAGDLFTIDDSAGFIPARFITRYGPNVSSTKVQFRATSNSAADANGNIIINILPGLSWVNNGNINTFKINTPIVSGMTIISPTSHRCGGLVSDDAFYLSMPQLPMTSPFASSNEYDPVTKVALRLYYGFLFGTATMGFVLDETHGSLIVPEYSMRILIPLSQA